MTEKKEQQEELKSRDVLQQDIVDFFKNRVDEFAIPLEIKFLFQANNKQKQLIKLSVIPEQYKFELEKDLLVEVNTIYFDSFNNDENLLEILFDQEIDKISYNLDKGTLKLSKPTFSSNNGIIDKYSFELVKQAQETEKLFEEQQKDSAKK
ncbi:hypothetical protein M0Q50_09175 [bacterium]|jgi:hypothetical protein|nr:hypothetical protein [bacterium]